MKVFVVLTLLCLTVLPAYAQETDFPKAELFGGYSFSRDGGSNFPKGFNVSAAGNINSWFGIVGDVSYGQGTMETFEPSVSRLPIDVRMKLLQYRAGPKFTFRASPKAQPFFQFLIGGARATADLNAGIADVAISASGISAAAGAGLDVPVSRNVAIRAMQIEYQYLYNSDLGGSQGVRVGTGVVIRF